MGRLHLEFEIHHASDQRHGAELDILAGWGRRGASPPPKENSAHLHGAPTGFIRAFAICATKLPKRTEARTCRLVPGKQVLYILSNLRCRVFVFQVEPQLALGV